MRKSRFTDAQIIGMIKKQEASLPTSELAGSTGSARRRFTSSRPSMAGWNFRTPNGSGSLRMRTTSSSTFWRMRC